MIHKSILSQDNPILREISAPFNLADPTVLREPIDLLKKVFSEICEKHNFTTSSGLSLIQIGIQKRGCIIWLPNEEPMVMINPQFTHQSDEIDYKYEGCLCLFDKRGLVSRHSKITVSYYDEGLKEKERTLTGWGARIVQHEIDHMDGKLYPDRMEKQHVLIDLNVYEQIKPYTKVQNLAKDVMAELVWNIQAGMSEKEISDKARNFFQEKGVNDFWYYDLAALTLVGSRTPLSVSGKEYVPSDIVVQSGDMLTVDLSPTKNGIWGDYARTLFVSDDGAKLTSSQANQTYCEGVEVEKNLHQYLLKIAKPDMTAHKLWEIMNSEILKQGFENLDFKKNLGHSIEKMPEDRIYIEEGNRKKLGDMGLFTFEPHIRKMGDENGFKHENIYYFAGTQLQPI